MPRSRVLMITLVLTGSVLVLAVSLSLTQSSPVPVATHSTMTAAEHPANHSPLPSSSTLTPTISSDVCPDKILTLSEEEQDQCIQQVGGMIALKATMDAHRAATVRARPTVVPGSGLATEVALMKARGTSTPTPTFLPSGLPGDYEEIKPIKAEYRSQSYLSSRYYKSVWHVGGMVSSKQIPYMLYVLTPQDRCAVETYTGSRYAPGQHLEEYEREWPCPQDLGEIVITGATGPTGFISFTNALSQTGTFDLATEEWTFD